MRRRQLGIVTKATLIVGQGSTLGRIPAQRGHESQRNNTIHTYNGSALVRKEVYLSALAYISLAYVYRPLSLLVIRFYMINLKNTF